MSNRYKGGIISATPPTLVAGAGASGTWTLEQQMQATAAGLWSTNGPFYIEEVFSTWLYTGNGSTQTITNGIDLSGKGGLVWTKARPAPIGHGLVDTARGGTKLLQSNTTAAEDTFSGYITSFNANGYTLGASGVLNDTYNMVSWTFRKQPKFFDVVTFTGTGVARTVSHNLGSTPGFIVVKKTSGLSNWLVWHRSVPSNNGQLNTTDPINFAAYIYSPDATTFSVFGDANDSGATYVAYLFAHNAGGFGLTGTDNVISCGSFTTNGSGQATVNLGYEPQWLMVKTTAVTGSWFVVDNMRGMPVGSAAASLYPNLSNAESLGNTYSPSATGFNYAGTFSEPFIYIAIRRGPMKVPTTGTSVFSPQIATSSGGASNTVTTNFPVDLAVSQNRTGYFAEWFDRLRGGSQSTYVRLRSASTAAEATGAGGLGFDNNTGYVDNYNWQNVGGGPYVYWNFRRAPSFFDEVCYTGTGAGSGSFAITHNLGAVPELIIFRQRNGTSNWQAATNFTSTNWRSMFLNLTNAGASQTTYATNDWFAAQPTATAFTVGFPYYSTGNYVAYLFATCPGVSKVGSFTGTGATQVIDCGFTGGARFVLIKATSTTGDWYVWDSARGIVAGNDPYLEFNTTDAEVTTTDWVDTAATGFELSNAGGNLANSNGVSYIFLAIA
jgi:hypothetical protein